MRITPENRKHLSPADEQRQKAEDAYYADLNKADDIYNAAARTAYTALLAARAAAIHELVKAAAATARMEAQQNEYHWLLDDDGNSEVQS